MRTLRLKINGDAVEVAAPSHWSLLEVLRYKLGLIGSKQGCDKGDCGACTVLSDGKPILACLTLAALAENHEITTIEGLMPLHMKEGKCGPDPVQAAFDKCGALQCGFCQPGMMLSARALLNENATPTRSEIREALSGNLCRCTGYTQIFEAVELAIAEAAGVAPRPRAWEAQRAERRTTQDRVGASERAKSEGRARKKTGAKDESKKRAQDDCPKDD